jgi:hypothetical protein
MSYGCIIILVSGYHFVVVENMSTIIAYINISYAKYAIEDEVENIC